MSTEFTPARIAELRALGAKATPGPWRFHHIHIWSSGGNIASASAPKRSSFVEYTPPTWEDESGLRSACFTAAFIAAADPPTILAALDEIERLRAENEKLREALEPFAIEASMMSARSGMPDGDIADDVWVSVRLGTCRRARRALEGGAS